MDDVSYTEIGYCDVPADLANVAQAAESLRKYCQLRGIDESVWPQLELVFCEAMNNAIEHGCQEDATKIVKAKWFWKDDELTVEIEDPGQFEPKDDKVSLPLDPMDERGRGEFLIDNIADSWHREPCEYGNRFVFKKSLYSQVCVLGKMQDMFETLQAMTNELQLSYSKIEAIEGVAWDLANIPILEKALQSGIQRMRSILNIDFAGVWLASGDLLELAATEGSSSLDSKDSSVFISSGHAISQAFGENKTLLIEDCSSLAKEDLIHEENAAAIICPIAYQRDTTGVVVFKFHNLDPHILNTTAKELGESFALFFGIAHASASAFERSEAQKRSSAQLEVASEIQKSLLPSSFPSNKFCHATGRCVTAMEVGGDYIDTIEIKDYGLLIIIADVMGKGVPAALLATIFRTAVRSRLNFSETPGWLLSQINKQIYEELGHLNMFITAQAAFYSYERKNLKLASGGHCPALLLRNEQNTVENLTADGMPLGIDPELIYEEQLVNLETGDRILFITDGLYESENRSGEMLGLDKLASQLPELWKDGVEAVPDRALTFVEKFEGGKSAIDDKTLMALEIL